MYHTIPTVLLQHSQLRCEYPPTDVRMGYLIRRCNYVLQSLRKSYILYNKSLAEAISFKLMLIIFRRGLPINERR